MSESTKVASTVNNLGKFAARGSTQAKGRKIDTPPKTGNAFKSVEEWDFESIMDHLEEIPQVVGYRIMLIPVKLKEMTKGGIALPDSVRDQQVLHAQMFRVVGMGALAYQDSERFPAGPFCKMGDFVMIGRYAGTKVSTTYCEELRIVNDDEIQAVVTDIEDSLDLV